MAKDRISWPVLNDKLAQAVSQNCELGARLSSALPSFLPQFSQLSTSLEPLVAFGNKMSKLASSFNESFGKAFDISAINDCCRQLQQKMVQFNWAKVDSFLKTYEQLPAQTRTTLISLAKRGWFIYNSELGLADIVKFNSKIAAGDIDEIESYVFEYYDTRTIDIEASILKKYKQRAHVIGAAFRAHRSGEYALSIPIFLIQADGICSEMIGCSPFTNSKEKCKRRPESAKFVEDRIKNEFMAALLAPLTEPLPISASRKQRLETSDSLNRHAILHGESVEYANKQNSLKAISLLYYLSDVLHEIEEDEESDP